MKNNKLYNLIFPLWIGIFMPPYLLIPLLGNLLIDGMIVYLGLRMNKIKLELKKIRNIILKSWGLGFAADITGVILLFIISIISKGNLQQYNPWIDIKSLVVYLMVIALTGTLIGVLNYKILSKEKIDNKVCLIIGIIMGIITAPWMFLIPTNWFYNGIGG